MLRVDQLISRLIRARCVRLLLRAAAERTKSATSSSSCCRRPSLTCLRAQAAALDKSAAAQFGFTHTRVAETRLYEWRSSESSQFVASVVHANDHTLNLRARAHTSAN